MRNDEKTLKDLLQVYNQSLDYTKKLMHEMKEFDEPIHSKLQEALEREYEHQKKYWEAIEEIINQKN